MSSSENNYTDPLYENVEHSLKESVAHKIPPGQKEGLLEILKEKDLLSSINKDTAEECCIPGGNESKNGLNLNGIVSKLSLPTIRKKHSTNKSNLALVVAGLFISKKLKNIHEYVMEYAEDKLLYIPRTFEEKLTALKSADEVRLTANPLTENVELQKTKETPVFLTSRERDTQNSIISNAPPQTVKTIELFKTYKQNIQGLDAETYFKSRYGLLKECFIIIPYEEELLGIFPNPPLNSVYEKLVHLIKVSAQLFQHQRCCGKINNQDVIVASWIDLAYTIFLGDPVSEINYPEILPVVYEIIEKEGYITQVFLQKRLDIPPKKAGKILNFLEENGLIYPDHALKISKGINEHFKVYVKTKVEYQSLIRPIKNIDWLKIKNIEESFIAQQFPDSVYRVSDEIFLPQYDSLTSNKVVYNPLHIDSEAFYSYNYGDMGHIDSEAFCGYRYKDGGE